jgi:hypothetical protein
MQRAHNDCNADGRLEGPLSAYSFSCAVWSALAASDLGTVVQTIKVHRARMMKKMKVRFIAELARLAERAGVSVATPSESTQPFILAHRPARTSLSGPLAYRFPI